MCISLSISTSKLECNLYITVSNDFIYCYTFDTFKDHILPLFPNSNWIQVSIQSISEALRLQTKTISTLSRKRHNSLIEEHNDKVLSGYESLLTITCKILGKGCWWNSESEIVKVKCSEIVVTLKKLRANLENAD